MKACTVCKVVKPLPQFYNRTAAKDGKFYRCKECDRLAGLAFRRKHYERYLLQGRKKSIKNKYGISMEEYESLRVNQNYSCAICGLHESLNKTNGPQAGIKRLSIDHCHDTGKTRGLLCNNCNRGLGFLGDTTERLEKVLEYLRWTETH